MNSVNLWPPGSSEATFQVPVKVELVNELDEVQVLREHLLVVGVFPQQVELVYRLDVVLRQPRLRR